MSKDIFDTMAKEEEKAITLRLPKLNLWMVATVVLAIALVVVYFRGSFTGFAVALTPQQISDKAVDFINKNLVQTGNVSLVSVQEVSGMYEVIVLYQDQNVPVYMTKDGSYLFLSQPVNTSTEIPTQTTQTQTMSKTDKPSVELFVMTFCPYGIQAEQLMKPVVDLLGTTADIKIRFITQVQGNTIDTVSSLHGANEALEDARQVCIMKNYDQKTYWDYLMEFNNNCPSTLQNSTALDACWKAAATKVGIDAAKIDTCSKSTEAIALLKTDEQQTDKYGVQGSPTLVINDVTYNGDRTADAFKQGICSAFTTAPTECSQTISSNSTTVASNAGCAPS